MGAGSQLGGRRFKSVTGQRFG